MSSEKLRAAAVAEINCRRGIQGVAGSSATTGAGSG